MKPIVAGLKILLAAMLVWVQLPSRVLKQMQRSPLGGLCCFTEISKQRN